MKKILVLLFVILFLFTFTACKSDKFDDVEIIYEEQSDNENGLLADSKALDNLDISYARDFSNGTAWIEYTSSGTKYNSLINTKGEILCTYDSSYSVYPMDKKAGYVADHENGIYKIINSKGEVLVSSEDGDYDVICANGDGMFFVYKYVSDIDTSKHMFGIIDSDGKLIKPLKECRFTSGTLNNFVATNSRYLGAGMFAVGFDSYGYNTKSYLIYSAQTNMFFFVNSVYYVKDRIDANGKIYFMPGQYGSDITYESDLSKKIEIGSDLDGCCFSLSPDGQIETLEDYDGVVGGMLVENNRDDSQLILTNPSTGKSSEFIKYPVSSIKKADKNWLITVVGKDKTNYFTLIDENCNMLFDPISYGSTQYGSTIEANEGKIIYRNADTDKCTVVDYSGKVLLENLDYKTFGAFYDGLVSVKMANDNYCYIDVKGNVLIV